MFIHVYTYTCVSASTHLVVHVLARNWYDKSTDMCTCSLFLFNIHTRNGDASQNQWHKQVCNRNWMRQVEGKKKMNTKWSHQMYSDGDNRGWRGKDDKLPTADYDGVRHYTNTIYATINNIITTNERTNERFMCACTLYIFTVNLILNRQWKSGIVSHSAILQC